MSHPRAAILAIGDELILGQSLDTNSAWLAQVLLMQGVETIAHRTVPDDRAAIARAIAEAAQAADVLVTTGGLGPTDDDITREALGDVLAPQTPLVRDEAAERELRRWFGNRGMPEGNLRQAMRPAMARCLANPNGTAPGLRAEHAECVIYVLPGPPREMKPMFETFVGPDLPAVDEVVRTATVHAFGLGESHAAERLAELTERTRADTIGTTVSGGIVTARLRTKGEAAAAEAALERDSLEIERRWVPYAFGRGSTTLPGAVVDALGAREATLVTAESCTGGQLGASIVDVPGASRVYLGGWVTYSNELKTAELGVPSALIASDGAVSRSVAAAMAEGARDAAGATHALSITGIAGPGGGDAQKPAGTVYIGLASTDGATVVCHFRFRGERALVRSRSAQSALQMLRFRLLDVADAPPLLGERAEVRS